MTTLAEAWAEGFDCGSLPPHTHAAAVNPYRNNAIDEARERVIEAAKDWANSRSVPNGINVATPVRLVEAVRALRELEGGK